MLCVLIDQRKRVIQYVHSGHNLICSMIAPDGEVEIMEGNLYPLGISSRIDIIEGTMPYSYENRLMLSRSNSMSKIVEEGTVIKRKVENALQNIKNSQKKKSEEADINTSLINDQDVSFDDETVLLISLENNGAESSIYSEKRRLKNMIATSIITSN